MKKTIVVGIVALTLLFPLGGEVYAQNQGGNINNQQSQGGDPITLPNPLGPDADFYSLLDRFIDVVTIFSFPILGALIVVAGFLYLFGGADPSKRTLATNIIKYGIIGFIVIIFARAIAAVVQGVIS